MRRMKYRPSRFQLRQADVNFSDRMVFSEGPLSVMVERHGPAYEAVVSYGRKPFALGSGKTAIGAINALWPGIDTRMALLDQHLDLIAKAEASYLKLQRVFGGALPPIRLPDIDVLDGIFTAVERIKDQIRKQAYR